MHADCVAATLRWLPSLRWRGLAAIIVGAVVLVGLVVLPDAANAGPPHTAANTTALADGWTDTPTGPLGPADRDLLVRVRQAGLWEGPAGQMAQARSNSAKVKEVGHHLQTDHAALDLQVRAVATQLGVALPDKPNGDQQSWLDELATKKGTDFDRAFADLLRAAHGKVFAVVAAVRAGTQNDTIRAFAQVGITVVMKHMTLLESIGLVDYQALPTPPPPALAPASVNLGPKSSTGINPNLVWLVLGIALIAGLVTAARVVRPR